METSKNLETALVSQNKKLVALALASTALLSGCGGSGELNLVSGVPAQIDYKMSQAEYDSTVPSLWPTSYYLGVEQCQTDIDVVVAGQPASETHFDPAVHSVAEDCFVKRVEVKRNVYDRYQEGQTVVFTGEPGESISRIS